MNDLKPCPFCGGEAKTVIEHDFCSSSELLMSAYVKCTVCGIYQRVKFNASHKQFSDFTDAFERVIGIWNQRV